MNNLKVGDTFQMMSKDFIIHHIQPVIVLKKSSLGLESMHTNQFYYGEEYLLFGNAVIRVRYYPSPLLDSSTKCYQLLVGNKKIWMFF